MNVFGFMKYYFRPRRYFFPVVFVVLATIGFPFLSVHAATSLLISSASVAADGVTVTVNISGVTGSLSPATGVTGFSLNLHKTINNPIQIATGTTSGSVVTLILATPVQSGDTVTLDLATSPTSNLTDTGSDTPSAAGGNTGATVTNNSTMSGITAGRASSSLYYLGLWDTEVSQGNNVTNPSQNSRIDFSCTHCTGAAIQVYPALSSGNVLLKIDGLSNGSGTYNTLTFPSASHWTWVSLASGLSDTAHTFSVEGTGGSTFIDTDDTIRVSAPTPGAALSPIAMFGTADPLYTTPFTTSGVLDGGYIEQNSGYQNSFQWASSDGGLRFNSDCTNLSIWARQLNTVYKVYRDGVPYGPLYVSPSTNTFDYLPVVTGSDGAMHTWEIIESAEDGSGPLIYSVMGTGCTVGFGSKPAVRPLVFYTGESYVEEGGHFISDLTQGNAFIAPRAVGMTDVHIGHGGQTVSFEDAQVGTDWAMFNQAPKIVIMAGGGNDMLDGTATSTFQTEFQQWITDTAAKMAATSTLIVEGEWQISATTTWQQYTNAIQQAVTNYNLTSPAIPAHFVNVVNWFNPTMNSSTNPTGDLGPDDLHPIAQGYAKIANREIPILNGYENGSSYSVSGPSAGTVSVASSPFTVTLAGGATFTGDQTITLSDGASGGTFTPSVGSPGVGSVVVTPTASTTNFTFTYTPSATGAKTISYTAGGAAQAWIDASNATYTSNAAPAPASIAGSPTSITAGTTGNVIAVTGTNTSFTGSPFTLSGGTGASITSQSVTDTTHANVTITAGSSAGTLVLTDTGSLASTTITVAAATPPSTPVVSSGGSVGVAGSYAPSPSSSGQNQSQGSGAPTTTSPPTISGNGSGASTASIQASIAALTTQLDALLAQAAAAGISLSGSGSSPSSFVFTRDLQLYDVGADVKALQIFLNNNGFIVSQTGAGSPGNETERFGAKTWEALVKFQKSVGIVPASGYFGSITKAYIAAHG